MVLSILHYAPSIIAALLTIYVTTSGGGGKHRIASYATAVFALIGLYGFFSEDVNTLFVFSFHSIHAWIGILALTFTLGTFAIMRRKGKLHCIVGKVAGGLAAVTLVMGMIILLGQVPVAATGNLTQYPASSHLPEVEASTFMFTSLTPINQQLNNAIQGTQYIDKTTYRLAVTGLVYRNLTLSYEDLLSLPSYSEVTPLNCVEGWSFTAKWTGFRVGDLLNQTGVKPGGQFVKFICVDGYTTVLPLSYLESNKTLLAYGLNDVTLPPDRGFPLQLVAGSKYGYKWAKWIVGIEVIKVPELGYWESRGYSDSADVGSFPYG